MCRGPSASPTADEALPSLAIDGYRRRVSRAAGDGRRAIEASRFSPAIAFVIAGVVGIAMGCGSTAPASVPPASAPPSSAEPTGLTAASAEARPSHVPVLGLDWTRAASVERPVNFEVDPSAAAYTGTHPILRIPGQA